MILMQRPSDPFWQITPPEGVQENPLGYWSAPNAATPDYVATDRIEEFIAYAFAKTWLSPDDFSLWWRMERHDVQWLRAYFLQALEWTLLCLYVHGEIDTDHANYDSVVVGNSDAGETEEVMLMWAASKLDVSDNLAFDFICSVLASADPKVSGGDPLTIWLSKEGYEDRRRVRAALTWAWHQHSKGFIEDVGAFDKWDALGVPSCPLFLGASCHDFTRWYETKIVPMDV